MSVHAKALIFYEKLAEVAREVDVVIFSDRIFIYDPESGDSTSMEVRAQGHGRDAIPERT